MNTSPQYIADVCKALARGEPYTVDKDRLRDIENELHKIGIEYIKEHHIMRYKWCYEYYLIRRKKK